MTKLVVVKDTDEAQKLERSSDAPEVGSWWWVNGSGHDAKDYDKPDRVYLACVIEVGSNYAKVQGVRFSNRLALDDFHETCTAEPNPDAFIAQKLGERKGNVRELMGQIQQLCHQLGVPYRQALAEAEQVSTALASAHSIDNVKTYSKALQKAKDKTLPDLFKQVREQHELMATWMKADLIPAYADLEQAKGITKVIEQKIHTVELYAGLQEELIQVREGKPASIDTQVHLMQRRHYMDEECLIKYEAGGMDFNSIEAFDKWLGRTENFGRLLPHDRCIVAFRIRRFDKDYGVGDSLSRFIRFQGFNDANKATFLYIRNGSQLWRMETSIDFDTQLFADQDASDLLGSDEIWIRPSYMEHDDTSSMITGKQRANMIQSWKATRSSLARKLAAWHKAGKPEDHWPYVIDDEDDTNYHHKIGDTIQINGEPTRWHTSSKCNADYYKRLTPNSIYYDDAMKRIARAAFEHNRVAVIVQGLLDRSTCLHPHPPWKIWTPEGFDAGVKLVYDITKAITPGEAPDFEAYRKQLNKSMREGSHSIGQRKAWKEEMEETHGDRSYRNYGSLAGDGPKHLDVVAKLWRDGSATFEFTRERTRAIWVPAERPGYRKRSYPKIPMSWRCKPEHLFCVDAYTPGDFHMFFDDPRTRADYLQWAPYLLGAEDWHHWQKNKKPKDEAEDEADED